MNAVTLGWFLCLSTILLIFLLLLFSYISKDEVLYFGILRFKAASVKKVFKVSACVQSFVIAYVWRVFSSSGDEYICLNLIPIFWEFWYIVPIKLYILENAHYIETSYVTSTCVYVSLSKYRFLSCYNKFPHFYRAEKEKNISLAWNWVDILQKWDLTLFTNCFLLLIAHCHLLLLMTHGTTWSTGQHKGHIDSAIHAWFCWLYDVASV